MRRNRLLVALVLLLSIAILPSCAKDTVQAQDVLTLKAQELGRTQITVLVKYAFSINRFEKAVEEKFPDIDLVQVGNFVGAGGKDEYAARLEHDDLTDVVMTWPLEVGQEYWEERLLDLSGMSFTSNYNISMLNRISTEDGKLYYLPGPSQVRGIVYNKTLFEENDWLLPSSYEEFLALCKTIEDTGIRAIQLGFANSEVLDTAFIGYGYADCLSKPSDSKWLERYNSGEGSFGDHFGPALDTFQQMIDAGIWKPEDLERNYSDREYMLFNRECAMAEDSVLLTRMGQDLAGSTDEFALMPFWNKGTDGDWARVYMVCYIGLNQKLAQTGNEEKLEKVMKLMEYVSTPEGQEALSADTGAMYSSVRNTSPPNIMEIQPLYQALSGGRYAVFPELTNAQGALREGLAGMLRGHLTKEQVVAMVDAQNKNPPPEPEPEILGKATANFSLAQTGGFVTDVLREYTDCELALFLDNGKDGRYSGKGISAKLYEGDVTEKDVDRILPDLKSGDPGLIWKVTMTGKDLLSTLEHAITVEANLDGLFYYASGLHIEMNPTAQPGSRMVKVTTADGKELEPEKLYSIAVMNATVPAEYLASCEELDVTVKEVVTQAVRSKKTISPAADNRFLVVQNP